MSFLALGKSTGAKVEIVPNTKHGSVLPFSMQLMKRVVGDASCCKSPSDDAKENVLLGDYCTPTQSNISSLVSQPMNLRTDPLQQPLIERIVTEYRVVCDYYRVEMNPGVLTTLRFCLPSLRVTEGFFDTDMLALSEILIRYINGPLNYIQRLDFAKHKLRGPPGFGSHGAFALAKVLQASEHLVEVFLERNKIGGFGAAAIFLALDKHPSIRTVRLRRCRIGEKGGLACASMIPNCNLENVDLSANYIGYHGCREIESAMEKRGYSKTSLSLDLEGNLVFQEIWNGITHGLGVLLAFVGAWTMSTEVQHKPYLHILSCAVYSISLVVLYSSSTLYHSFFSMRNTKWVFEVLDKCAIYILISGSYTPFLSIVLAHEPLWSTGLLAFLWLLCCLGIGVEFSLPTWQHRSKFSLAMYLGMGWSALVCLPEVSRILPADGMNLMILGGVSYTAGVPFFVRNNNLDHAIWHLFVLAGSIFHWCGIYFYVTPFAHHHGPVLDY